MKARHISEARRLEDLPNIGPAMARDLTALGIATPHDLAGKDAFALYRQLEALTGSRHDPCVLDTFLAAVAFAEGGPARPWWSFTAARQQRYGQGR
jgi:hypothetical protein